MTERPVTDAKEALRRWPDPFARFDELLARAKAVDSARLPEPTAFALGTVDDTGQPSVRIVLLKGVDRNGFVFYTNHEGRKGRELRAQPKAAATFHWQPLEISVRVEGSVSAVSDAEGDRYFASRARGSQIGAWASLQSRPMERPDDLERRVAEYDAKFAVGQVPRPAHWNGFRLVPARIEFWRGMPNRLHERHCYTRDGSEWRLGVLYP